MGDHLRASCKGLFEQRHHQNELPTSLLGSAAILWVTNVTALSPTDTAILSRWAKALSMLQALISLSIIAILASRAVGML